MGARFLTTCSAWDLRAFSESLSERMAVILIVSVSRHSGARRVSLELVGDAVQSLWRSATTAFPEAAGHRVNWDELWFLVPNESPESVAATATKACFLEMSDAPDVWVATATGSDSPLERIRLLDDLSCGLQKIDYRKAYPDAWCAKNGTLLNRPA